MYIYFAVCTILGAFALVLLMRRPFHMPQHKPSITSLPTVIVGGDGERGGATTCTVFALYASIYFPHFVTEAAAAFINDSGREQRSGCTSRWR